MIDARLWRGGVLPLPKLAQPQAVITACFSCRFKRSNKTTNQQPNKMKFEHTKYVRRAWWAISAVLITLFSVGEFKARAFQHPGIPLTISDLNNVKTNLGNLPWSNGYAALVGDTGSVWRGGLGRANSRRRDAAKVLAGEAVSWAEQNPEAAATLAVDQLPAGRLQEDTVVSIVQRWAQSDTVAAATWVAQFPEGSLRKTAVENLVAQLPPVAEGHD
jgi:hypothetical protein